MKKLNGNARNKKYGNRDEEGFDNRLINRLETAKERASEFEDRSI